MPELCVTLSTFPFVVTLFTLFVNYWRVNVSLFVVKMLIVNELSV